MAGAGTVACACAGAGAELWGERREVRGRTGGTCPGTDTPTTEGGEEVAFEVVERTPRFTFFDPDEGAPRA
jgi:hypothetical protein